MNSQERMNVIRDRLQSEFLPSHLDVIDDSDKHIGHAGAQGGAGHYTVIIQAEALKNQSRIESHRAIYRVLNDLIPDEIHALRILS